jgi:hypothetical protein
MFQSFDTKYVPILNVKSCEIKICLKFLKIKVQYVHSGNIYRYHIFFINKKNSRRKPAKTENLAIAKTPTVLVTVGS